MKRIAIIVFLLCLISSAALATEMNWLKVTGKATFKDDVQIGSNTIDEISTDGTLGGNSDNAVPTEKAVRAFVESKIDAEFFVDSVDSDLPNAKVLDLGQGLEWVTTGSGKNIACKISSSTELGIAKSSDTGNITINNGDWSLNLNSGDSYANFGDSDDDTINELFEAIDNAWPGGGSGTSVELDLGNDGSLESTAITRISTTGDTNSIFTEPSDDELLIDASKNWPTADVANAGDSATAFFSSGTIEHERGGLEADVSAYDGLVAISGGVTSEINTSSDLADIISDETGTGALVFGTNPTFIGGITLSGADADPTATGQIVYDSTIAGMAGGALRWHDNDSVRLIVDLETDPSDDDYVVAYDADADGFYLKEDSTGAGGSPGGADTNVQFNDGGTFGGQSDFIFEKADSYLGIGTSDATAELDIANSAPTARLKGLSTSYASNAKLGEIQFTAVGPNASEGAPEVTAKIRAEAAQSWSSSTSSSRIEFWITPWNTNTEEEVFMIQPMSGGARFRFGSGGHQPATAILEIYDDTSEGDTLYVRKSNNFYNKSSFVSNNNYDVYHTFIEGTTYFSYGIDASYDRFRMTGTANVSSSQILMIDPDGGIVIGEDETTPDTDSVLELEHEDGANFLITRWDSSTYSDDLIGSISFAATDGGSTGDRNEGAAIRVYAVDDFSSTDSASKIEFWTAGSSSTTLTRRWVINGAHFRTDAESNAFMIPRVYSDNATTFPAIYFGHARGTIASPSASQDGDILGRVAAQGHDGSAFASAAYITMKAAQNWSGSARASKIVFSTNGTGESAPDDTMEISGDNGLRLMENDKNGTSYQAAAAGKYRTLYVDENGYVVVGDTDKANND